MTLREAMTYMYHHPYVKMECGPWMFEDKWIMWVNEDWGFRLYDPNERWLIEPDHLWWHEAMSLGYDWWIKE